MSNIARKFVYELAIPVRWYDMDAFGHVNTSVYFTYFEQARISWGLEITSSQLDLSVSGPVVVDARCTFIKSIIYPETIMVKLYIGSLGRSSYDSFYEIGSEQDPDIIYAEGYAKMVWVDRKAARAMPIPAEFRQFFPEK